MRFDSFVHAVTDDQVLSFAGFASTSVRKPYRRFFANWGLAFLGGLYGYEEVFFL
jgi:hypothetical protein